MIFNNILNVLKVRNMIHNIMEGIIEDVIDDNKCCLISTNESQGHGKAYEIDIQKKCFGMNDEEIKSYKQCDKYDIRKEHNRIHVTRNVSIKTSGSPSIDCGDIIRFLDSEDLDIVIILYNQKDDIKESYKTCVIKFEGFLEMLQKDILKYCNMDYVTWLHRVQEYDTYIKSIPHGKHGDKSYKKSKEILCKDIPYFNISPKVDSKKQRRVQCSIHLDKLNGLNREEYPGGILYGKEYTKQIKSSRRNRHIRKNNHV